MTCMIWRAMSGIGAAIGMMIAITVGALKTIQLALKQAISACCAAARRGGSVRATCGVRAGTVTIRSVASVSDFAVCGSPKSFRQLDFGRGILRGAKPS